MPPSLRALTVAAWLIPVGILAQAVLAGQGLYLDPSLFGLHGGIGHGVLLLALLAASFIWAARFPRHVGVLASLTVVGLLGQVGLGYAGRRSALEAASAVHVPLGVTLLGLSVVVAVLVTQHSALVGRTSDLSQAENG
ncbi:hypothetical protein FTX61_19575 [Nitriliruptoraceae bacterium ZYF776]|nr:hypothetical protein [Profundirhabdus halotolerans]